MSIAIAPTMSMPIVCHKCIHYYVTWDPNFPHGCRGMGFKSRRHPNAEIRAVMNGKDCRLYVVKKKGKHRRIEKIRPAN